MQADSDRSVQLETATFCAGLRNVPLFHAAWLFALGVVATRVTWMRPIELLGALALISLLCVLAVLRAQRIAWVPLALLWCLLGTWCAEMEPRPAPAPALYALSDGLLRTLEGTVTDAAPVRSETEQNVDEAALDAPSQRIDVRVDSIEMVDDGADAQESASGGVRLTIRWPPNAYAFSPFHCGDRIRAVARLLPPEVYHDPGTWSRADYLLEQGVTSTASINIDRIERLGSPANKSASCHVRDAQRSASARLMMLPTLMVHLPTVLRISNDDAIMLTAMVTGDRTFLTHALRVGFERTGSFHMLVVSGFHLAIVAGCILWLARKLRMARLPATLITIGFSLAYALFTGFATPVQRSLWMVSLYLLGRLFYRERSVLNTIGFAALCLLAVSPRSLFDSSFQMTLLAVVSIGGIAAPLLQATIHPYVTATRDLRLVVLDVKLPQRLAQFRVELRMIASALQAVAGRSLGWRVFPWTLRSSFRGLELIVVSCVVELAMSLPMAMYFHRITLLALPVNLLILPLLLFMMPSALLTLIALLIWPPAAMVPGAVAALLLHIGVSLVHVFGSLAWGDVRIPSPLLWQSVLFCVLLGASIWMVRAPRPLTLTAACAALLCAAVIAICPRPVEHPHDALVMEAIDVGQGDSLLLITPDGKTLLVDGGGFGGGPQQAPQEFDIGEEVVSAALWSRGIRHLDVVALSHAHSDHMGGLPSVLRNFHPDELWVGKNPRFAAYNALLDEAMALHVRVRSLHAGDAMAFGSVNVNVLAPFADYQPGIEPSNNDSLVLHVSYGVTSVMLEGDAEAPVERAMLRESGLESTLLKVGHHGSVTSTRPEFLSRVSPSWAVISCGLHNRYRHPREEVLQALQAAGVRTYSTDINGVTCFTLNGRQTVPDFSCGQN